MPKADTQFKKGQSGNPTGRSKDVELWREECRKHHAKALRVHLRNIRSALKVKLEDVSPEANSLRSVGGKSAQFLLEQAFGKARQQLDVAGADGGPLVPVTAQDIAAALKTAIEAKEAPGHD